MAKKKRKTIELTVDELRDLILVIAKATISLGIEAGVFKERLKTTSS